MSQTIQGAYGPVRQQPETPTWSAVLQRAVENGMRGLRVALPGQVVAVRGDQLVDVQPTLMARFASGPAAEALPVLPAVPVCMPRGATWGLRLPVAVGDKGLVVFSDRSLDAWSASVGSQLVDPADGRMHHLLDGVFLPGLYPDGEQTQEPAGDVLLHTGAAALRLEANGKVTLGSSQLDLVDLAQQLAAAAKALATALGAVTTTCPAGTGTLSDKFVGNATKLGQLATKLGQLKG